MLKEGASLHYSKDEIAKAVDWLYSLKPQNQKKPADEVGPKFKVGDWIVSDNDVVLIKDINLSEDYYTVETNYGDSGRGIKYADNKYHLWTIKDAKEGNLLASVSGDRVFLFFKLDSENRPCAGCGIYRTIKGKFFFLDRTHCDYNFYFTSESVFPATQEQRKLFYVSASLI